MAGKTNPFGPWTQEPRQSCWSNTIFSMAQRGQSFGPDEARYHMHLTVRESTLPLKKAASSHSSMPKPPT